MILIGNAGGRILAAFILRFLLGALLFTSCLQLPFLISEPSLFMKPRILLVESTTPDGAPMYQHEHDAVYSISFQGKN